MGNVIFNFCIAHKGQDVLKKTEYTSVYDIPVNELLDDSTT